MEEQLNITILQEKRPVTFKSLARTHGIHVNTAKQALWDYAQNTPNVHAIYCIAGRLMTDNNTDTIRLVKDLDLEEAKKQFHHVTGIHVYSVIPYDPMDLSVLVTANKEIPFLTVQDRIRCGVLEYSKALEPRSMKQSPPAKSTPPPPLSKPSTPAKPTPAKATNPPAKSSPAPPAKKPTATKKKGTLSFGNHAVKTKSPSPQVQEKKPTPELKKPALKASDIFSDDEDMTEPSPIRDPEPTPEEPMEEDFMDMDEEPAPPVQEQSEPEEAVSSPQKRPLEPVTPTAKEYTDDRGYWVTEAAEPPKREVKKAATLPQQRQNTPKSAATPAKKAAAKKGQGQALLSSFFKKK